jgi:hypothetical protein
MVPQRAIGGLESTPQRMRALLAHRPLHAQRLRMAKWIPKM